jgi:predicted nucleic acid-binding protein
VANETIVINTGPLILLEKAQAFGIISQLPLHFIAPLAVEAELGAGTARGFPAINPPWLNFVALSNPVSAALKTSLDLGEAEVIQLAIERGHRRVCLDDLKGRQVAVAAGLEVVGVLGLLALAKSSGIIPAMKPFTDRLVKEGAWYSPALVQRVLRGVGE